MMHPFDAVLVVSFGGPGGMDDVRPFLANVLRGRAIPPARLEDVVGHYAHFDGVSPLTAITLRQARGLEERLAAAGPALPVYVGMRNWHPLLPDTMRAMARDGVRRAIGLVLAPHRSYSSCTQYKQNVADARAELLAAGGPDVTITYTGDWHAHPSFIEVNAQHAREALARLSPEARSRARIIFTAHSVPASMTGAARYEAQIQESARLVAAALGAPDWTVVFQSRSGRPQDPWLGPDICEYLRALPGDPSGVVLVPIGFVCDHIEVLWDLDVEATAVCRELGLPMARAETVNDDPLFLDMTAAVVRDVWARYGTGRPLPIVSAAAPERHEGPPPARHRP